MQIENWTLENSVQFICMNIPENKTYFGSISNGNRTNITQDFFTVSISMHKAANTNIATIFLNVFIVV